MRKLAFLGMATMSIIGFGCFLLYFWPYLVTIFLLICVWVPLVNLMMEGGKI